MNIIFDADGVLFDTEAFQLADKAVRYFEKKHHLSVVNENGYGIESVFGCSKEIEMEFWTRFVVDYSLFFKPRLWFPEMIKQVQDEGDRVFIATSKACALEHNYRAVIVRFLFEQGLKAHGIHVDGIRYCSLENSAEDKVKACLELDGDLFIEDKKENACALSKVTDVLLMHTKNNADLQDETITRVYDANDVYTNIRKKRALKNQTDDFFRNFILLSRKERSQLTPEKLCQYYDDLKRYYCLIPFSDTLFKQKERNYKLLARAMSFYFEHTYSPAEVIGRNNLPEEPGFIITSNHLCNKDMLLLMTALKDIPWHPLIKEEILKEPTGLLFELAYSVFVDRSCSISRHLSTQEMAKVLMHRGNIVIFPEGTYNLRYREINLLPFSGASPIYLSQVLQKQIIPTAITQTYGKDEFPIVRLEKPFVVSRKSDIEQENKLLYRKMSEMVEENNQYVKKARGK